MIWWVVSDLQVSKCLGNIASRIGLSCSRPSLQIANQLPALGLGWAVSKREGVVEIANLGLWLTGAILVIPDIPVTNFKAMLLQGFGSGIPEECFKINTGLEGRYVIDTKCTINDQSFISRLGCFPFKMPYSAICLLTNVTGLWSY